jgi:hypothetical protein
MRALVYGIAPTISEKKVIKSGLLGLLCGAGNFGKIWCAFEQRVIQRTK